MGTNEVNVGRESFQKVNAEVKFSHESSFPGFGSYEGVDLNNDGNADVAVSSFTQVDPSVLLSEENDEVLTEIYAEVFKNWEDVGSLALILAEALLVRELQGNTPEKISYVVLRRQSTSTRNTAVSLEVLNGNKETLWDTKVYPLEHFMPNPLVADSLLEDIVDLLGDTFAESEWCYTISPK